MKYFTFSWDKFSRLYRRTIVGAGKSSALVRLKLSRVGSKRLRVLTHVTVENRSHGYDKCRLGIDAGGVNHYIDELQTIAANELAVSRSDVLLFEGDSFFAELTGTTNDDQLLLTAIGWTKDL